METNLTYSPHLKKVTWKDEESDLDYVYDEDLGAEVFFADLLEQYNDKGPQDSIPGLIQRDSMYSNNKSKSDSDEEEVKLPLLIYQRFVLKGDEDLDKESNEDLNENEDETKYEDEKIIYEAIGESTAKVTPTMTMAARSMILSKGVFETFEFESWHDQGIDNIVFVRGRFHRCLALTNRVEARP